MARITVEDCLKRINNRFIIVQMANTRTTQFYEGSKPLVEGDNREVVTSLREIAQEKVIMNEETVQSLKDAGCLVADDE